MIMQGPIQEDCSLCACAAGIQTYRVTTVPGQCTCTVRVVAIVQNSV